MKTKARVGMLLTVVMLIGPSTALGQARSWKEVQVDDIRTMHEKFRGLAEAFDAEHYDWRPMEGVRSVREVLGLAVAEAYFFPTAWGYEAPAEAGSGFGEGIQRAAALDREPMIGELDAAFDFMIQVVDGMSEEERSATTSGYGGEMPLHASIAVATYDMHEHLGQLIAYARTNRVVPPWSRDSGG